MKNLDKLPALLSLNALIKTIFPFDYFNIAYLGWGVEAL
jgi:hypothetical protein